MNAREAMQALLEGKTITTEYGITYKLGEDNSILLLKNGMWHLSGNALNDNPKIVEEYPLTFKEAIQAMLDGKIVAVDCDQGVGEFVYKFNDSQFWVRLEAGGEDCDTNDRWEEYYKFYHDEQHGKWKVVEE